MLAFLADTGVHVGELVGLEVDDLDFKTSTAPVTGKFGRNRRVRSAPRPGRHCSRTCGFGRRTGPADSPCLWIGQRGPLNEAAVWRTVKLRGEEAGIMGLHPHTLRHTFAHRFRAEGGAPDDLQQLGGWRSSAMLNRYGASAATERALAAHARVDPLGDVL